MEFKYDDGGRRAAGFAGSAGDCVARAIAIAGEMDYGYVYEGLADGNSSERRTKRGGASSGRKTARDGIHTSRAWFKSWMAAHGFRWVPTMQIGSGCKVHLAGGELPAGRLVVSVSKHYTAVIDGVIHDTHDPQREPQHVYGGTPVRDAFGRLRNPIVQTIGGRCVYGYWVKA
jgi:hypothetical protein